MNSLKELVFLFIFAISACFAEDSEIIDNSEKLTLGKIQLTLKKGLSQSEIITAIGSPNMVTKDKQGRETWVYDKLSTEQTKGSNKKGWAIGAVTNCGGDDVGVGGGYADQKKSTKIQKSQKTLTVIINFKESLVDDYSYHASSF